ncbi:HlyD family secretion protein [Parasphingopyxis marina]|uniref:HlyD family secretion protein n=1 Tax=Parasphingopyxis marina TaxID=2761622 RepID=A0A842HZ44_9SPHN|nr:HlyD family secretion protein [Parasphingopyxis marina]MBC2777703.1 HlyD family secretion protein [Parasphingopyxis marina]
MADDDPTFSAEDLAMTRQEAEPKRTRSTMRVALMLLVPLIVLGIGAYWYISSGRYVSTDNAYVQQDIVEISPEVNGRIVAVMVQQNQHVEAGDILFRIDPEPYRIAVEQADADISDAQLSLDQAETAVATSGVDIETARANVAFASRNLARERELMDRGFNTRARVESFENQLSDARARLNAALAAQQDARAAVGSASSRGVRSEFPAVAAARARRSEAQLNLERTVIRAPVSGTISEVDRLQIGQMASPGTTVVSIVADDETWVEANFKETDLDRMRIGQPARITFDAYPGFVVEGRVQSIGAGTGAEFSILPPQNATGNWVKVTQRVPVRIAIEGTPSRPMITGLSADVRVDVRGDDRSDGER